MELIEKIEKQGGWADLVDILNVVDQFVDKYGARYPIVDMETELILTYQVLKGAMKIEDFSKFCARSIDTIGICKCCGKEIDAIYNTKPTKYCSIECRLENNRNNKRKRDEIIRQKRLKNKVSGV